MHKHSRARHAPPSSDAEQLLSELQSNTLRRSAAGVLEQFMRHTPFMGVEVTGVTLAHIAGVMHPLVPEGEQTLSPWPWLVMHHVDGEEGADAARGPLVLMELPPERFNQLMTSMVGLMRGVPEYRDAVLAELAESLPGFLNGLAGDEGERS